jgi:hypothetical protein
MNNKNYDSGFARGSIAATTLLALRVNHSHTQPELELQKLL